MYEIKLHADRCDLKLFFSRIGSLQTMDASSAVLAALQTARRHCSGIKAKPAANGCPMAGPATPGGSYWPPLVGSNPGHQRIVAATEVSLTAQLWLGRGCISIQPTGDSARHLGRV